METGLKEKRKIREKYILWALYGVLFLCFAVTRIYMLDRLPAGIHVDEASMSYSAWCLANYGVDRYLDSWPVYLVNFTGGQSIMYAYLCALLFKIFGYNIWLIRMPAAFFSLLTLVFGIKAARRIRPEDYFFPLFIGLLITVCPYFIMAARFGLDCNLMLGMSTVFLYFVIKALQEKRWQDYLCAGIAGGLTLYTYALSYVAVPIFLVLLFLYVLCSRSFSLKNWAIMGLPMALLAFPLILVQFVNAFDWPEMRLGIFTITKMSTYRASEFTRIKFVYFKQALNCLFESDGFRYNMAPGYKTLYGISKYLFCIGIFGGIYDLIQSIRKKETGGLTVVLLWFVSILFLECHLIANVNKLNGIYFAYAVLAAEGVCVLCRICRHAVISKCVIGVFVCVYIGLFADFSHYYYGGAYMQEAAPLQYFGYNISEAVDFLEEQPNLQNKLTRIGGNAVFYAASTLQSPYELALYDGPECIGGRYYCGDVEEIEDGYNYIIWGEALAFADELTEKGYTGLLFGGYALYYQ